MFVGTQGGGVFRSTDNAETWTGVNNGLTDTNVRALAINNASGHIFGGTWSSGVFRSTDNGDSWTAVNNGLGPLSVRSLVTNSGGDVFAGSPMVTFLQEPTLEALSAAFGDPRTMARAGHT